jgi:hypothetical protein
VPNAQSLARPPRSVLRLRSFMVLSRVAAYSKKSDLGLGTVIRGNFLTHHDIVSALLTHRLRFLLQYGPKKYPAGFSHLNNGQSIREYLHFIAFFRLFRMV